MLNWRSNLNFPLLRYQQARPFTPNMARQSPYLTSPAKGYTTIIGGLSTQELENWIAAYKDDKHYRKVNEEFNKYPGIDKTEAFPQYYLSEKGLIYFQDSEGNTRLCVPTALRADLMKEKHDIITEGAHGGYFKTYNRITSNYYWPKMSRDIKRFVNSCDVCQKIKPRRHAPFGKLQSIPIAFNPFEVVSMDFITELPDSNGYDSVLVIIDKLTKYAIFVPTTTTVTKNQTAELFFKHVVSKFGMPSQVISDRDPRWSGEFWKEICRLMGSKRALTTAYHPQADGQTEIMNQYLEISIRSYINEDKDNWEDLLDSLAFSYNTSVHTATGFSPAYLLHGYQPKSATTLEADPQDTLGLEAEKNTSEKKKPIAIDEQAHDMIERFTAERSRARDALLLGQIIQEKYYNQGRLIVEYEEGDLVLINRQGLGMLRNEKGRGAKLLPRYDGPFEILKKISPVTYRLRMPASYGTHPVLNISHLEKYHRSPSEFGPRQEIPLQRAGFDVLQEVEVERIIAEKWVKGPLGRRIPRYRVRYVGFGPEDDEWKTKQGMKNAPEVLIKWERQKATAKKQK